MSSVTQMKYLLPLLLALAGCGVAAAEEPPVSLIEPPVPPTTYLTLTIDASTPVNVPADILVERLPAEHATDTLPPPSPREIVNSLPYDYVEGKDVALQAFSIVARENGWSPEKTAAWLPFADDVIAKESGYCWNLRRGAIVSRNGCVLVSQGTGSDAGFAQLTSVHHGPGMWACVEYGVCGANAVIASPWVSMSVFIWLLDREQSRPWCYSDWARSFHKCGLAPD